MKNHVTPLVTIGVASYNNEAYILETLNSIVSQTYNDWELIIVDDFSKDNSVHIIEEWIKLHKNYKILFIKNPANNGVCKVLNAIILNANGYYLSTIGSDDIYVDDKIEQQVNAMLNVSSDVAMCYSSVLKIDENGGLINNGETLPNKSVIHEGHIFVDLLESNFIPAISHLTKLDVLKKLNGFDEGLTFEDWDMWLRVAKDFKIIYVPMISAKYRIVSTSAWNTRSVKFYESTNHLLAKHLGYNVEGDEIIKNHINKNAELIYKNGGTSAARWLKQRWYNQHSLTAAILYVMAVLHLPYSAFERLRKLL